MQTAESAGVKQYFEKAAEDFDSIYSGKEKGGFRRWLDRVLRADMYQRYELTIQECSDPQIRTVLDIGTGSGRFCLPLAEKKDRILGIDFSQPMIDMARERAKEMGLNGNCEFKVGDFLEMDFPEKWDAIMAIGLFDYVRDLQPFVDRMAQIADKKVVASFPTIWTWRAFPRWLRLRSQGCPVFFWTKSAIRRGYEKAGLRIDRFERVGKIYFVVASPARNAG